MFLLFFSSSPSLSLRPPTTCRRGRGRSTSAVGEGDEEGVLEAEAEAGRERSVWRKASKRRKRRSNSRSSRSSSSRERDVARPDLSGFTMRANPRRSEPCAPRSDMLSSVLSGVGLVGTKVLFEKNEALVVTVAFVLCRKNRTRR